MTERESTARDTRPAHAGYQVSMLVLCLYALLALGAETVLPLTSATRSILDAADYVVCVLFFLDFLVSWRSASDRGKYLRTWGWLDLLSSIPMFGVARLGRVARVARIFRLLRGLRIAKVGIELLGRHRARNTLMAATLATLLLLIIAAIAVLQFEVGAGGNIRTAEDALWWAITTLTTVGYGDRYPISTGGRAVATVLMVAGVGLFGILSGLLASWFVGADAREETVELEAVRVELAALRVAVERLGRRL